MEELLDGNGRYGEVEDEPAAQCTRKGMVQITFPPVKYTYAPSSALNDRSLPLRGKVDSFPIDKGTGLLVKNRQMAIWAARLFQKTGCSLAALACYLAGSSSMDKRAKPSREVRVGDLLQVRNDGGKLPVQVLLLVRCRGPARVAQTL